jgi:histidinol-phosphate phosphatase family protein
MSLTSLAIDSSWTLFLDRDGVINRQIKGDYVRNIDSLEILPDALEAIVRLNSIFGRTVVVTNQQGIGKGLMTEESVRAIHSEIQSSLQQKGGYIDAFYFAPQLASANSMFRKPKIGMALEAQKDFPEIDFNKSIIAGDSESDMLFGENAGMRRILINSKQLPEPDKISDFHFSSLSEMAQQLLF